mmetsp:Transcript_46545/g.101310  ORF Transcript_46545/g.101310 Transcript_46545/m.101310 type:complete len:314 (+) Transcript_46545:857-1798(+)
MALGDLLRQSKRLPLFAFLVDATGLADSGGQSPNCAERVGEAGHTKHVKHSNCSSLIDCKNCKHSPLASVRVICQAVEQADQLVHPAPFQVWRLKVVLHVSLFHRVVRSEFQVSATPWILWHKGIEGQSSIEIENQELHRWFLLCSFKGPFQTLCFAINIEGPWAVGKLHEGSVILLIVGPNATHVPDKAHISKGWSIVACNLTAAKNFLGSGGGGPTRLKVCPHIIYQENLFRPQNTRKPLHILSHLRKPVGRTLSNTVEHMGLVVRYRAEGWLEHFPSCARFVDTSRSAIAMVHAPNSTEMSVKLRCPEQV